MTIQIKDFDATKYFANTEDHAELLTDALETKHAGYIEAALGVVAKSRGNGQLASETGLSRQALHKALSENGNPTLDTVLKVLDALGRQLSAKPQELGSVEIQDSRERQEVIQTSKGVLHRSQGTDGRNGRRWSHIALASRVILVVAASTGRKRGHDHQDPRPDRRYWESRSLRSSAGGNALIPSASILLAKAPSSAA